MNYIILYLLTYSIPNVSYRQIWMKLGRGYQAGPLYPVQADLSRLTCEVVVYWLSCPGCPVPAVLSRLSCPCCPSSPVLTVLTSVSCADYRLLSVLAVLSRLSCPDCPVPTVLSRLFYSGCPAPAVLSCPDILTG
jgi:hypothetical protein